MAMCIHVRMCVRESGEESVHKQLIGTVGQGPQTANRVCSGEKKLQKKKWSANLIQNIVNAFIQRQSKKENVPLM